MTAPFQWRQPVTPEVINYVAQHMRESDKRELEAMHGPCDVSALARLLGEWANPDSPYNATIAITDEHGVPAGICGCNGQTIWMLGTEELTSTREHRRLLLVEGRKWVEELLAEAGGPLHNYCLADNKESIRWLKALGFAFAEPQPMGPSGRLFRYFWRNN
jgi:hypothetical protein